MAMEPAAISARPATTTRRELATAPRPAASAKGTVRPSERPMTMSRTRSVDLKWCSRCWSGGLDATWCMGGVYDKDGEKLRVGPFIPLIAWNKGAMNGAQKVGG